MARIWLSDDQGLRRVTGKLSVRFATAPNSPTKAVLISATSPLRPDGSLWAATRSRVCKRFDQRGALARTGRDGNGAGPNLHARAGAYF